MGQCGIGTTLTDKAECAFSGQLEIAGSLFTLRPHESIGFRKNSSIKRNSFAISVYAPIDCGAATQNDEFRVSLVRMSKDFDIAMVAGDFNAKSGKLIVLRNIRSE